MPNLSWVEEDEQQAYLDAFRELVLPQTEVLVGNHQTLSRLPAARLGRRAAAVVARARRRRRRARRALRAGDRRAAARPVPRQRAGLAAGRDHRREVRALRGHLRRRRRHAVGRAGGAAGHAAPSCTPPSARRSPSSTRPRRGLPPRHGQRRPRPLLLGPAAEDEEDGRRRRRPTSRARPTPPRRRRTRAMSTDARARRPQRSALRARPRASSPAASTRRCAPFAPSAARRASSRAREGAYIVGRRGQALHRLHRLLGADDPRPRPPGGARGGAARGRRGPLVRRADRARDRAGRGDPRATCRAMEQVRLVSSGTEAAMSAMRLARGATGRSTHRQVRGLLPRPRRRAAGQGRLGPGDLRPSDQRRRAARGGAAHAGARVQQRRAARRGVRAARRRASPA